MSNYESAWKEAQKTGKAKNVMPSFFKFESKGDHVVGKLMDIISSKSRYNEDKSSRYTVQTDKGLVEFNLTQNADKKVALVVQVSGVYAFVLNDLVDTGKSTKMKDFGIYEIVPPDGSITKQVREVNNGEQVDEEQD
jgi:hypothetical protein